MKNKLSQRSLVTCLISLIILAAYNILYWVIPFNRDVSLAAFLITYIITNILILSNIGIVYLGFGDKKLSSRVFGIPVVQLGTSAVISQFVIDILVMIIGSFVKFPYWIVVVLEVLLLSFFAISLIVRKTYQETIAQVDVKEDNEFIKELRLELDILLHTAINDEKVKTELRRLYETAKYTTPSSKECVYEVEDEIRIKVSALKGALQTVDNDGALESISSIVNLLRERKARLSV